MKKFLCLLLSFAALLFLSSCRDTYIPEPETSSESLTDTEQFVTGEVVGSIFDSPVVKGEEEITDGKSRYCYSTITPEQQRIYRIILFTVKNFIEGYVDLGKCSADCTFDVSVAYRAVLGDFPEYFWMPSAYTVSADGTRAAVSFTEKEPYPVKREDAAEMTSQLYSKVAQILEGLKNKPDAFRKEIHIHDEICKNCSYDKDGKYKYTSYGALVEGKAVCEGFSRAFQLVSRAAGFNCITVSGESRNVGHMWNMFQIEDRWYHVDVTWDGMRDYPFYTYLNLSNTDITRDHKIDPNFNKALPKSVMSGESYNFDLPIASSSIYNYFTRRSAIVKTGDTDVMYRETAKRFHEGYTYSQLRFANSEAMNNYDNNPDAYIEPLQKKLTENLGDGEVILTATTRIADTIVFYFETEG